MYLEVNLSDALGGLPCSCDCSRAGPARQREEGHRELPRGVDVTEEDVRHGIPPFHTPEPGLQNGRRSCLDIRIASGGRS